MRSMLRNIKQGLGSIKNRDQRSYTSVTRHPESGEFTKTATPHTLAFPQNMGYLTALTHDRREEETVDDYKARCLALVQQHIQPDHYTFFAYGTIIKNDPPGAIDSIIQKFIKGQSISISESKSIIPGHIALYTAEKTFISHTPKFKKTQDDALAYDVHTSIKEQQQVSTYIVVLSKDCFLDNLLTKKISEEETTRLDARSYHWGAAVDEIGEKDNCATRIQKTFFGKKNINTMNPLETLLAIITLAGKSRELTDEDYESLAQIYEQTGVTRSIQASSWDEEHHRIIFDSEKTNKESGSNNQLK